MSWKTVTTLCLCTLLTLTVACGIEETRNHTNNTYTPDASHTPDATETLTPITFEEYRTQAPEILTEFMCASVFFCTEKQPLGFINNYGIFANKADCMAQVPDLLWGGIGYLPNESEAIKTGRLAFDSENAAECIAHAKEIMKTCQSVDEFMASFHNVCKNNFIPKVQETAPCMANNECISNLCVHDESDECFGRCAAPEELPQENEVCGTGWQRNGCADDLYCIRSADGTSAESYCTKPKTRQKGETCDATQEVCADNMICTLKHVCDERPTLSERGEPCGDNDKTICRPGLTCLGTATPGELGTCITQKAAGESCTEHYQCRNTLYCTATASTPGECTAQKAAGEPCQNSKECMSPLFCDPDANNTCNNYPTGDSDNCEIPAE